MSQWRSMLRTRLPIANNYRFPSSPGEPQHHRCANNTKAHHRLLSHTHKHGKAIHRLPCPSAPSNTILLWSALCPGVTYIRNVRLEQSLIFLLFPCLATLGPFTRACYSVRRAPKSHRGQAQRVQHSALQRRLLFPTDQDFQRRRWEFRSGCRCFWCWMGAYGCLSWTSRVESAGSACLGSVVDGWILGWEQNGLMKLMV